MQQPGIAQLVDEVIKIADLHMRTDGYVAPVTMFQTTRNADTGVPENGCLMMPWSEIGNKDQVRFVQERIIDRTRASLVLNVVESWGVKDLNLANGEDMPRPSKHPNRIEMVVIHAESREGETITVFLPILREGDSARLDIENQERANGGIVGRFGGYFRQEPEA